MSQFSDEGARPSGLQLVFRRHPETGLAVEGRLRWGLFPHYADARPDLQPIHARAETISEKKMFRDAYRKRRCIVPMNSFFQKDPTGKRYAISRRDGATIRNYDAPQSRCMSTPFWYCDRLIEKIVGGTGLCSCGVISPFHLPQQQL
jgi:SOS response associated peptidase (SRAP)